MSRLRCLFRLTGCIAILLAPSAGVRALTVDPGSDGVRAGVSIGAAIVEGRPAIAYADDNRAGLKFVRAADAAGTAWGTPVMVDTGSSPEGRVFLVTTDGNPAVCYYDLAINRIRYARATSATGDTWGAPVIVDTGIDPPGDHYTLEIVDGKPAVCFTGGCCGALKFIRALDASGSAWGPVVDVDIATGLGDPSMKIVEGRPAIVYFGYPWLWFVRAADAAGTAWDAPVKVVSGLVPFSSFPCLQVVNGRPAVAYREYASGSLKYVRAANALGTAWSPPAILDSSGQTGFFPSLAVVNGKPAIGYFDLTFPNLMYVECTDSDGDTAAVWRSPVSVDTTGGAGPALSLLPVNGRPALIYPVYHESGGRGSLEYFRSTITGESGGALWPPDLVLDYIGTKIPNGGLKSFGTVAVGSRARLDFTLKNPNSGSSVLNLLSVAIDGPDAAEFSVVVSPATVVDPNGRTVFTLQYAPVTPGMKSATLHITSNADSPNDFFDLRLAGDSLPDIQVEQAGTGFLEDGGSTFFPLTAPGSVTAVVFTIHNPGGSDLNGFAITIDGPDAGEFSIASPPAAAVAPGGTTTFTVRHGPVTTGAKTTSLHIASNVTGSKNPFDLTLRMVPGMRDDAFEPVTGTVTSIAVQPDGKILAGGLDSLMRLNPDGSPDVSFFSPAIDSGFVRCMALQKDGRILIGGDFEQVGGQPRTGIARLLGDGSVDGTFAAAVLDSVDCLAVQQDGRILVGGDFTSVGELSRSYFVRLNAGGSFDDAFLPRPDNRVRSVVLQPDGRILIAGRFSEISAVPADRAGRLHADGTPDETFSAEFDQDVRCLAVQADGRIFAGGNFAGGLARLLPGGGRDPSMTLTADNDVYDLAMQADGKCLVAGLFSTFGGVARHGLARVNPDGSLDESFNPWQIPRLSVRTTALQTDGKVLFFGDISDVGDTAQLHLMRLQSDPAFSLLRTEGRTVARWMRGGTAPEVRDVTFDLKPDNSPDWTRLGSGSRIPGGWELSGLTLPPKGTLRAQGYSGGSLIESVSPILTPLESWRLQFFNTPDNTGDAADDADPDQDGLTNFTEFAFGLSPLDRTGSALPEFKYTNNSFTATFTVLEGRESVLYGAEWSPTMQPGSWTSIPETGTGGMHTFTVPMAGDRNFVRYIVRMR